MPPKGDNLYAGYKNWYRISNFSEGEWKHVAKLKKQNNTWANDNGCESKPDNEGW